MVNWPPGCAPETTSGSRFARAAYSAAVSPAGPEPRMMTFQSCLSVAIRPLYMLAPMQGRPRRALTHLDARGRARMVDVGDKAITAREAMARGEVKMKAATLRMIISGRTKKGDVLAVARVAGILAAKRTHELIPLCHPLPIQSIALEIEPNKARSTIEVEARVRVEAKTGVEMEALTAVAVACLTIYDMVKAVDRGMTIGGIRLIRKSGGKSGTWTRAGRA